MLQPPLVFVTGPTRTVRGGTFWNRTRVIFFRYGTFGYRPLQNGTEPVGQQGTVPKTRVLARVLRRVQYYKQEKHSALRSGECLNNYTYH